MPCGQARVRTKCAASMKLVSYSVGHSSPRVCACCCLEVSSKGLGSSVVSEKLHVAVVII